MEEFLKNILTEPKRGSRCWMKGCKEGVVYKLVTTDINRISTKPIPPVPGMELVGAELKTFLCTAHAITTLEEEKAKGNPNVYVEELPQQVGSHDS